MTLPALDTFAGACGWDLAIRHLGWGPVDRVENWAPANATAAAAGFGAPVCEDVREYRTAPGRHDLQTHSPSCRTFTLTGKGEGRRQRDRIIRAVAQIGDGFPIENVRGTIDSDAALTLEPLRLILEGLPRATALEQAPSVLPVWQAYADVMTSRGYVTWVGIVDAAQYGVPADRKRAVLLARRDSATMPVPFAKHWHRTPTMGEALGWPEGTFVVSNYGTGGDASNRGIRRADQPAATVTGRADRNKVHFPDGTVRNLTLAEAARLQTFPADHPWRGTKAQIGQQIGNAVPPLLAVGLLTPLLPSTLQT